MLEQQRKPVAFFGESISTHQKVLDPLIAMTERITNAEGRTQTIIPFLSIVRHSHQTPLIPSVLTPSFCLILQGTKKLYLGQDILKYHPGDYLASVIDMPASAQIIGATKQFPYIGLRIDFTTQKNPPLAMQPQINLKPHRKNLNTQ